MGIIYNNNVKESRIYQAYGLTVYGKINSYEWTIYNYRRENALITIRIIDESGNDIFSMYMGNNCILQCWIDDTMDNFLWWIAEEHPDSYTIEKQVYSSLCSSNCLFNNSIQQRKLKRRKEEEEKKRIAEREKAVKEAKDNIKAYCDKNNLISYFTYEKAYLIKTHNEKAYQAIKTADNKRMESFIDFMEKHPDNTDACIVKDWTIEEILNYMVQED